MSNNRISHWPTPEMVEVRGNKALLTLYAVGGVLAGAGLLTVIIAFANKDKVSFFSSGENETALAWLSLGNWVLGVGILLMVLGAVAHAINWQIETSAHRQAYFMTMAAERNND